MSSALFISISFGLGVSGLFYNLIGAPRASLANRILMAAEVRTNKETIFDIKQMLERISLKFQAKSSKKISQALLELPEVLDLIIVSLRSGEGIYQSLQLVVPRASGEFARELSKCLFAVLYGAAIAV